jgi:uncharacterized membrane protein
MSRGRLEAFSDGVIAIIITIMVLEMRPPQSVDLAALQPLIPVILSYILSFIYLGIYWNNHHHMLHAAEKVSGGVLWANLHLLFWLSLIPFVTAWMGEHHFARIPMALYGVVLLCAGVAYHVLERTIIRLHGPDSLLAQAVGTDFKGRFSILLYLAAIPLALYQPWISGSLYVLVALFWLIPDPRIERTVVDSATNAG